MKHTKDRVKAMAQEVTGTVTVSNIASVESLMKRGLLALEDSNWLSAGGYFNKVLDIDPEYAPAYVGLLCEKLKIINEADLANHKKLLDNMPNYQKALRFADADYRTKLVGYNEAIKAIVKEEMRSIEYKLEEFRIREQRREEEEQKDLPRRKQRMPELKRIREQNAKYCGCISAKNNKTIALKMDGTVVAVGSNSADCNIGDWRDIVAVAVGHDIVGLKVDGTLITTGHSYRRSDILDCRDIIAVSMARNIVAIKSDGTVVTIASKYDKQCQINSWRDIIAVSNGVSHVLGLKADGTVVAYSHRDNNSDYSGDRKNVEAACNTGSWRDIVAIYANTDVSVGLKADGTVIMANESPFFKGVMDWRDIVAVSMSRSTRIFGIKTDGTVVAADVCPFGSNGVECNTGDWRDIVAVAEGDRHTVGLKADGTVVAVGRNDDCQCNTGNWCDIVAIAAGARHTVGLKADGTVVAVGNNQYGQCNTDGWKVGPVNKVWLKQGLCRHCGGQIGGLLTKKCKSCGMPSNIK